MTNRCVSCYVTAKAAKIGCMTFCGLLALTLLGLTIAGLVIILTNPDCGYKHSDDGQVGVEYDTCAISLFSLIVTITVPIFLCIAVIYGCYRGSCSKYYIKFCIPLRLWLAPGSNYKREDNEPDSCSRTSERWCIASWIFCSWAHPLVCMCISGEETLNTCFQSAGYTYDEEVDRHIMDASWSRYVTWPSCAQSRYVTRLVQNTWLGRLFNDKGLSHDNVSVLEVWKLKSKDISPNYYNRLVDMPSINPVDSPAIQTLRNRPILTTTEEVLEDSIEMYSETMGLDPEKEVLLFHAAHTEDLKNIIKDGFRLMLSRADR